MFPLPSAIETAGWVPSRFLRGETRISARARTTLPALLPVEHALDAALADREPLSQLPRGRPSPVGIYQRLTIARRQAMGQRPPSPVRPMLPTQLRLVLPGRVQHWLTGVPEIIE